MTFIQPKLLYMYIGIGFTLQAAKGQLKCALKLSSDFWWEHCNQDAELSYVGEPLEYHELTVSNSSGCILNPLRVSTAGRHFTRDSSSSCSIKTEQKNIAMFHLVRYQSIWVYNI